MMQYCATVLVLLQLEAIDKMALSPTGVLSADSEVKISTAQLMEAMKARQRRWM